jgi:hypothetical protein
MSGLERPSWHGQSKRGRKGKYTPGFLVFISELKDDPKLGLTWADIANIISVNGSPINVGSVKSLLTQKGFVRTWGRKDD